jgi:signal transduction histidine kinase
MARSYQKKRLALITIVYWFLLLYLLAALGWWFFELWQQNEAMFAFKKDLVHPSDPSYERMMQSIRLERDRNIAQYIGEGSTFMLLTIAGAIFVYRATRRQIRMNDQQRNFMMAVTHELKTPIAVAKLNLETLRKHKLEPEKQLQIIGTTLQETNRLNDLCNNILLSSQMEAGGFQLTKETCNLSEITAQSAEEFRQRFTHRIIETEIAPEIRLQADMLMMKLSINNLVENALKYSPGTAPVKVHLFQDAKGIELSVADRGPGVPAAEKAKVFEKFYRIGEEKTRQTKGTGLGLYLTRKIVEDHGGRIFIRDHEGGGSIFVIRFDR